MSVPVSLLATIVLVFGFLTGSTFYYYNKLRVLETKSVRQAATGFQAETNGSLPQTPTPSALDSLTSPAEPKNRLSYPANSYTVQPKESLAAIGNKMNTPWQLIQRANNLRDENALQAGAVIAIPKKSRLTDYYRVEFLINEERATILNQELRNQEKNDWFDPIAVAKKQAPPYFSLTADDSYSLLESDLSKGQAAVSVTKNDQIFVIGLTQPKIIGTKGLWALLYIERQDAVE